MPLRAALALIVVLAAVAVAGCGGSSGDQTTTFGNQTVTVPSDAHGVYAELEAILGQLPYEAWYTICVVRQVEKVLSPAEAERRQRRPDRLYRKGLRTAAGEGTDRNRQRLKDRPRRHTPLSLQALLQGQVAEERA